MHRLDRPQLPSLHEKTPAELFSHEPEIDGMLLFKERRKRGRILKHKLAKVTILFSSRRFIAPNAP
jgi:hypothetical protein